MLVRSHDTKEDLIVRCHRDRAFALRREVNDVVIFLDGNEGNNTANEQTSPVFVDDGYGYVRSLTCR